MPRIASVWLERWPIRRLLREQAPEAGRSLVAPADASRPLVLSMDASGGPRISALNEAAEEAGLALGDRIADARVRVDGLQIRPAQPLADREALRRLGLWCSRYTPTVALWGEDEGADGLFLDVTGATHLFGGEASLLEDLAARLRGFRLPARLALAGTRGIGWALARFGGRRIVVVPPGEEERFLRDLPVEALRVPDAVRGRLRRLGFRRAGDLMGQPRAPLSTRFGAILLRRLDQALGHIPEPVEPLAPPPLYRATRQLLEPIGTHDAIVAVTIRLMGDLASPLERDGVGARLLELRLHRVDGEVASLEIGLAAPTRDAGHVARLTRLKLERLAPDAGHGFEVLQLQVLAVEAMANRQTVLAPGGEEAGEERLAALIDILRQRFGLGSVHRLWARERHIPEWAVRALPHGDDLPAWPLETGILRPALLLVPAEPAEAVAAGSDGPPLRFRWRGAIHHVAHAEGPERIGPEWWHVHRRELTRDYYMVEDRGGRRFWLYREGLPDREEAAPRWFVHGLFA